MDFFFVALTMIVICFNYSMLSYLNLFHANASFIQKPVNSFVMQTNRLVEWNIEWNGIEWNIGFKTVNKSLSGANLFFWQIQQIIKCLKEFNKFSIAGKAEWKKKPTTTKIPIAGKI